MVLVLFNFGHSLLIFLRENCFNKFNNISMPNERKWLDILDCVQVSIKRLLYLGNGGKSFPWELSLFIIFVLLFRP